MATRVKKFKYIKFFDIEIDYGSLILQTEIPQDFEETNKRRKELEFKYDSSILVKDEQVALALSLICVRYEKIYFDGIQISENVKKLIEDWTGAQVFCELCEGLEKKIVIENRQNFAALFSGGFDSTALLTLMPDDTIPIHLSFGGLFTTETKIISDYKYPNNIKPVIVTTNLYHTMLQRNAIAAHFLTAIPIILLCEHLSLRYFSWGHILEAAGGQLLDSRIRTLSKTLPPLEYAGVECIPYINGLTEYGTTKILLSKSQEEIEASYQAARCSSKAEKLLRKKMFLNALGTDIKIDNDLIQVARQKKSDFTKKSYTPFALLYALQKLGTKRIREDYNFISEDIENLIKDWDLSFYTKLNPIPLEYFPKEFKEDYLNKLSSLGIEVYSESDLAMLEKARILTRGIVAGNFRKYEYNPHKVANKEENNSIKFHFKKLVHLSHQRIFKGK